jgi:uncharacterized protein
VPTLVITEVAYLVASRLGTDAEIRFLGDLAAGNLIAEPVAPADSIAMRSRQVANGRPSHCS